MKQVPEIGQAQKEGRQERSAPGESPSGVTGLADEDSRQDPHVPESSFANERPAQDMVIRTLGKGDGPDKLIDDVLETVYGESWSRSLLWLAISAGPLTYVALQAGYLIAFGKLAPFHIFVYFAIFTLVAGLGGIVFRIYDVLSRRYEERRSRAALNDVLSDMPDILSLVRNLRLYDEKEPGRRAIDAAYSILTNSHSSPEALSEAVLTLTGSDRLSRGIRRIEVYRSLGMIARVNDIISEISEEASRAITGLREEYPATAHWLELRLMGCAPSLEQGLERSPGFLERVLMWMGSDNDDLLRQRDVEEILVLLYEFLCGREIPMLSLRFKGDKRYSQTLNQLNKARNNYRIATAARFSRLKAIARLLRSIPDMDFDLNPLETEASELLKYINQSVNQLCDGINQRINQQTLSNTDKHQIRRWRTGLKSVIDLYIELMEAHSWVEKSGQRLRNALASWEALLKKGPYSQINYQYARGKKRGVDIVCYHIRLRDDEKIALARDIHKVLSGFLASYKDMLSGGAVMPSPDYLSECHEDLKQTLIECFSALDTYVHISNADRQRAIEALNAPNLGSLETNTDRETKRNRGLLLTREVRNDVSYTAENLFRTMISQYDVLADDKTIDVFVEKFGARPEVLEDIYQNTTPGFAMPELAPPEQVPRKPVLHQSWQQVYQRARYV